KMSAVPVFFNINELMVFGVPIVLNPIYLIPFICVPLLLTTVSFFFMRIGVVPYTVNMVEWTTPILLSGYVATGSILGSCLQFLNLALGTTCYIPFVRLSVKSYEARRDLNLKELYDIFWALEKHGTTMSLMSRSDSVGGIARSLSLDFEYDLRRKAFDLHYQPIVNDAGKVVSVEALLRWNHQSYGLISPPLAVALAEEAGLIDRLGDVIFEKACKDLQKMKSIGINDVTASVNVSVMQLENDNFTSRLGEIIADHDIRFTDIEIEVTERLSLTRNLKITRQIEEIQKSGMKLAMDDFGAGHGSLIYLKEYNFNTIKIDGSLVREVMANPTCRDIISSIVSLGKTLNCRVVAEFVEEEEQRMLLKKFGCEFYQGYLFSKALPIEEVLEYIQENR
nr:EAL domain-containing protein [Synergistaceae bacterium]